MRQHLLGMVLCLSLAVTARQSGDSKPTTPPAPSNVPPAGDKLVKALLAADGAQNKTEKISAEELKAMLDREIAVSLAQAADLRKPGGLQTVNSLVLIDGAVYLKFGDTIYPMPGGGASGCFDPNAATKLQQARLKFAEQAKTEKNQPEADKKQ